LHGAAVPRARPDFWRALTLLARSRLTAMLSLVILLAEVLGFSFQTLLPTFARDVFEVGAAGLGTLLAARSAGGVVSLLALARFGAGERPGLVLLGVCCGLGLALVGFASASAFWLAVLLLALSGAVGSVVDSLSQTLLQRSVPDRERGAATGIWVFSVGFGPFGHLGIGAAAGVFGAPLAQALSGGLLVLVAGLLALNRSLRRMR
jgi:MFS family permease